MRTEEFTVFGADRLAPRFSTIFCPRFDITNELMVLSSVNRSSWYPWPTLARREPTRTISAGGQLRALNRLRAEALGDLAIGIDASLSGEIDGRSAPYHSRDRGGLRSSRTDRGAQALPPAGATVPPWLPAKSARVSNLPACCALCPPACAAPCSCHHEACSAGSAWPHPGKACPSV